MKATLTVNKAELRAKLEARVEEIRNIPEEGYERDLHEAIELRKKGEDAEAYLKRTIEYYTLIIDGLQDGSITISNSGRLSGQTPQKPAKGKVTFQYSKWTLDQMEKEYARYERQREHRTVPVQTAIELLDMATGSEIEIDAADYQALLSGPINGY